MNKNIKELPPPPPPPQPPPLPPSSSPLRPLPPPPPLPPKLVPSTARTKTTFKKNCSRYSLILSIIIIIGLVILLTVGIIIGILTRTIVIESLTNWSLLNYNKYHHKHDIYFKDPFDNVITINDTINITNDNDTDSNKKERNVLNWIKEAFYGSQKLVNLTNDIYDLENDAKCGRSSFLPKIMNNERIMNGKEALPHSWPWTVSIALEGPRETVPHACGGTLINKYFVITAAHCVMKSSIYNLVGRPVRYSNKYGSAEKMMKVYAGVHDRKTDSKISNMYGVEAIFMVKIVLLINEIFKCF
jgi:hypothetical protein